MDFRTYGKGIAGLKPSKGFTLIELLVVIAIIFILTGITIGIGRYARRTSIESKIKMYIPSLVLALESYRADNGAYPPLDVGSYTNIGSGTNFTGLPTLFITNSGATGTWASTYFLWRALSQGPKVYFTFPSSMLKTAEITSGGVTTNVTVVVDPLGNPYGYVPYNPVANPETFDLFSSGFAITATYPTNLTDTKGYIGNWHR